MWCVCLSLCLCWSLGFSKKKSIHSTIFSPAALLLVVKSVCCQKCKKQVLWENVHRFWISWWSARKTNLLNNRGLWSLNQYLYLHRWQVIKVWLRVRWRRWRENICTVQPHWPRSEVCSYTRNRKFQIILQGNMTECQLWNVIFWWHGGQDSSICINQHLALPPPASRLDVWYHTDVQNRVTPAEWFSVNQGVLESIAITEISLGYSSWSNEIFMTVLFAVGGAALCCVVHQCDITASGLWYLGLEQSC